jgi:hypothetical protein
MPGDRAAIKLAVREVDLNREREGLLRLLKSCLGADIDEHRLEWLYFANPHGHARVWLLEDRETPIWVGAAIPRKLRMSRSQTRGCILSDFCVSSNYRSIGPALQLQRACLQAINGEWSQLAYDLPSVSMLAVYKRLGIIACASLARMAKPLRIDRQIRSRMKSSALSRVANRVGNVALAARDRVRPLDVNLQIQKHEEPFGEEFDVLFERVASKISNWIVDRSSAYLNWRFLEHPRTAFTIWTARRKGQLEAYAISQKREHDVQITELFGEDAPGVLESLVLSLADNARAENVETLSLPILNGHPWQRRLEETGFYVREMSPLVTYGGPAGSNKVGWLTDGDRDS